MKKVIFAFILGLLPFLIYAKTIFAHQPRIVESSPVEITNPEVSQAFYGQLQGNPALFHIHSDNSFSLYVGLLVPDIPNAQKNISAEIDRVTNGKTEKIAVLDGNHFRWTRFYEEFGMDYYWWGPEFKASDSIKGKDLHGQRVSAGDYQITVYSPTNTGKYTLVTGFLETFPFTEIVNATITVPRLKVQFFNYPITSLLLSPYVIGYILILYLFSFVIAFLLRILIRRFAKQASTKKNKNIGTGDRLIRLAIGIGVFVLAVTTSWNPFLFIVSGFAIFEALFSWCIFYVAIGKNTCPV